MEKINVMNKSGLGLTCIINLMEEIQAAGKEVDFLDLSNNNIDLKSLDPYWICSLVKSVELAGNPIMEHMPKTIRGTKDIDASKLYRLVKNTQLIRENYKTNSEGLKDLDLACVDIHYINDLVIAILLEGISVDILDLTDNFIEDIYPLRQLESLGISQLYLSSNKIRDISPVKDLESLEVVSVSDNYIGSTIKKLGYLPKLKEIDVSNNLFYCELNEDLFSGAVVLFSDDQDAVIKTTYQKNKGKMHEILKSHRAYKYNTQFGSLDLTEKLNVYDAENLNNFIDLYKIHRLNISKNKLIDLWKIKGERIKSLVLNDNFLEGFNISDFPNLEELYISKNKIKNLDFLKGAKNLRSIHVIDNDLLTSIEAVKGLSNLDCFFADNCPNIKSFEPLGSCKKLKRALLGNCGLEREQAGFLGKLENLDYVKISGNPSYYLNKEDLRLAKQNA